MPSGTDKMPLPFTGEFKRAMEVFFPFEDPSQIAVAVSGGGDSLAVTLLLNDWVQARGGSLLALTVDHGLRVESADEAVRVADMMASLGIPHKVLHWTGEKPQARLQETARQKRYDLLQQACFDAGILHLAVGHTREDQMETVLMRRDRMQRTGATWGLSGMSAVRYLRHVRLLRPVLNFSRQDLRQVCDAAGLRWIEDPSNQNINFERIRWRQDLSADQALKQAAQETMRQAAQNRKSETEELAQDIISCVDMYPEGYARLRKKTWDDLAPQQQMMVMRRVLRMVSGSVYAPRLEQTERLVTDMKQHDFNGATLSGCVVDDGGDESFFYVLREPSMVQKPVMVKAGQTVFWDKRFQVRVPADVSESVIVRAGDAKVLAMVKEAGAGAEAISVLRERRMPSVCQRMLLRSLPCLWQKQQELEKLLCIPHFSPEWAGRVSFAPAEPLVPDDFALIAG